MKTENDWKKIWENRIKSDEPEFSSDEEIFMYMKKIDGYDGGDFISYEAFREQLDELERRFSKYHKCESVFEVGCGSGPCLLVMIQKKYEVGGIDYSESLLEFARRHLDAGSVKELVCGNALNMDVMIKYDAGISNGVFSYFPDLEYTKAILDKLMEKCRYSAVITDLHDFDKKEDFIAFRKREVPDYEEKYKNLPKLFYPKSFFRDYAAENGLVCEFFNSEVTGYWNNEFVYNVCLYRN